MKWIKEGAALFRETYREWTEDKVPRLAAAMSYYTAFSIAPLLVVVIAVAGLFLGEAAVRGELDEQIRGMIGPDAAETIQGIIANTSQPSANIVATVIGVVTLLLGAGGVFGQLQDALNTVWGVEPKPGRGIMEVVKARFFSFTMVLGVGFLLLVSLVISAILTAFNAAALGILPGSELFLQLLNQAVSFAIITLLFAMIFKILPDVEVEWRDVWVGAAITALLFTIGKYLIGLYLGNSSISSTYGAAGSFAVILVWIFYSTQILLFGAEFTQVYAKRHGSYIRPAANAVAVSPAVLAAQGRSAKVKAAAAMPPLAGGTEATPPIPSLQTPMTIEESPPPGPPLPLLWMAATALVSFMSGIWAAGRRSRAASETSDR